MLATYLLAALLPLSLASPVVVRQTTTTSAEDGTTSLLAQITTIESDITTLNNTLNSFEPDAVLTSYLALEIQEQTSELGDALTQATTIVNNSDAFNDTQSFDIAIAVLGLEPYISTLLDNIVAHKDSFETVLFLLDLSQTVEQDLETQKSEAATFGTALVAKLSTLYADLAPSVNDQIQDYFTTAIAAFQSCGGTVCLPSLGDLKA